MASYEIIEAFNSNGMGLNRPILKHIAHQKGIPHQTVHLWVICKEGIVIQQRAATKKTHPLFWDVSVAGHVQYRESLEEALVREAKEELGIFIDPLDCVFIDSFKESHYHPNHKIIDCEFHHCFSYSTKLSISQMKMQEEEIAAINAISIKELRDKKSTMVPHSASYYLKVLQALS